MCGKVHALPVQAADAYPLNASDVDVPVVQQSIRMKTILEVLSCASPHFAVVSRTACWGDSLGFTSQQLQYVFPIPAVSMLGISRT